MVAFRNDIAPETFEFPEITDDTKRLWDIREENPVPAKYYLSDVYVETLRRHKLVKNQKATASAMKSVIGAMLLVQSYAAVWAERNLVIDMRQKNLTPTTHIKGKINKEGIRKMTPREGARLKGFPDSFVLPLADTHLYKLFGNSVTVNVIAAIAEKSRTYLIMITGNKGEWS